MPALLMESQMVQGGSGIQMLAAFGDVFVSQRAEVIEAISGFETANEYDIFGTQGGATVPIAFAAEQSECCERQCCGSSRSFQMQIMSTTSQPIFSIWRPLRCKPPLCCCYLQELAVCDNGAEIGRLEQQYTCCATEFNVVVGGLLMYKIAGPCCVCDGPFCGDQEFFVTGPNGQHIQTPVGPSRITKKGADNLESAMTEMFTDADNFCCTFPLDATPEAKAVLLAAVFMIDFMFFEEGGDADGNGLGDD